MSRLTWRQLVNKRAYVQPDGRHLTPLIALAILAWLVEMLDGATGVLMMQNHGYTAELNPLVRGIFRDLGPIAVVLLLKLGPSTIVLAAFLGLARKRPVLARNVLVMALILGIIGVLSNLG